MDYTSHTITAHQSVDDRIKNDSETEARHFDIRFSRLKRRKPVIDPTKIGITYRPRRNRQRESQAGSSDLSVISYNSNSTFGRFDQHTQEAPIFQENNGTPTSQRQGFDIKPITHNADLWTRPLSVAPSPSRQQQQQQQQQQPIATALSSLVETTLSEDHIEVDAVPAKTLDKQSYPIYNKKRRVSSSSSGFSGILSNSPSPILSHTPSPNYASDIEDNIHPDDKESHAPVEVKNSYENRWFMPDVFIPKKPEKPEHDRDNISHWTSRIMNKYMNTKTIEDLVETSTTTKSQKRNDDASLKEQQVLGLESTSNLALDTINHPFDTSPSSNDNDNTQETAHKSPIVPNDEIDDKLYEQYDDLEAAFISHSEPSSAKGKERMVHNETISSPTIDKGVPSPIDEHQSNLSINNEIISSSPSPIQQDLSINEAQQTMDIGSPSWSFDQPYASPSHDSNSNQDGRTNQKRIDPEANFAARMIAERNSTERNSKLYGIVASNTAKCVFASGLPSGMKMTVDTQKAIEEATDYYFTQLCDDLKAYADHTGTIKISKREMDLLMTRQRLVTENTSLNELAHRHLPRDFWDEQCVSALAYNYLYPRNR
ncbi:uncharacterized protein BX664DRAFT_337202 [Halteromyces radiatus]|uniref:uncharacterized protein n=1 Tax=Halteromyces radiatus TaxID=101107 RepID=UPI00221FAE72|nr:uncharacterized protein BX664DRAFT_337202 [Halteromyces radiatus]KAI8084535.1 hypothetical protein BX664DRAFT_337202 [Halteromyces radiatus]